MATFDELNSVAPIASAAIGVPVRARDVRYLVEAGIMPSLRQPDGSLHVRPDDACRTAARVHSQFDLYSLFGSKERILGNWEKAVGTAVPGTAEPALIVFAPGLAVSYTPDEAAPEDVQRFLSDYRRLGRGEGEQPAAPLTIVSVGPSTELMSTRPAKETERVARLWRRDGQTDYALTYAEAVSAPSLYGNKSRITQFIGHVTDLYLESDARCLDVMCGTGLVSRVLSRRLAMTAADANLFAIVLARAQNVRISPEELEELLAAIDTAFVQNSDALKAVASSALEFEASFLHGHVSDEASGRYDEFLSTWTRFVPDTDGHVSDERSVLSGWVAERMRRPRMFPYCLVTAYFANAYFGVEQSIELDSLRHAIDSVCPDGPARELMMGTLLATAVACASGPHFAQPPRLSGVAAMAELVEHRSRSVKHEFETLARVAEKRPVLDRPIRVLLGDWRASVESFGGVDRDWTAGVYVDPPYSKLQYSRYYHVLNTLVDYDYPACIGQGRYPERARRFSSRFEHRPTSALNEFSQLFATCAERRLVTFVSYSDRGFVAVGDLAVAMERVFPRVHTYTKRLRHHSQGVRLKDSRQVTEYVLVGFGGAGE